MCLIVGHLLNIALVMIRTIYRVRMVAVAAFGNLRIWWSRTKRSRLCTMFPNPLHDAKTAGTAPLVDVGVLGRHGVVVDAEKLRCPSWGSGLVLSDIASLGRPPTRFTGGFAVRIGNVVWHQFVQTLSAMRSWRLWRFSFAGKLALLVCFSPVVLGAFLAFSPWLPIGHHNSESNLGIAVVIGAVSSLVCVMLAVIGSACSQQMDRSNALPVVTEMVDIVSIRDFCIQKHFVTSSVRDDVSSIVISENSIPSRGNGTNPIPTVGLPVELDFFPEPLNRRNRRSSIFHGSSKKKEAHPHFEVISAVGSNEARMGKFWFPQFGGDISAVSRPYRSPLDPATKIGLLVQVSSSPWSWRARVRRDAPSFYA